MKQRFFDCRFTVYFRILYSGKGGNSLARISSVTNRHNLNLFTFVVEPPSELVTAASLFYVINRLSEFEISEYDTLTKDLQAVYNDVEKHNFKLKIFHKG